MKILCCVTLLLSSQALAACPPAQVAPAAALELADCLASPDPKLRDELAFESLHTWMRGKQLDAAAVDKLRLKLLAMLDAPDPQGFAHPFAVLSLAEVARVDRLQPFMSPEQRAELVKRGTDYLTQVRDYRGYDAQEGWRHGVAHSADLMLQLVLNPALTKDQAKAIMQALASQSAPAGHFYLYGEGERIMAPLFYLSRRDLVSGAEWDAWFAQLVAAPKAPMSQATLARKHNLKALLQAYYVNLQESKDEAQRTRMRPLVLRALKQLD